MFYFFRRGMETGETILAQNNKFRASQSPKLVANSLFREKHFGVYEGDPYKALLQDAAEV